MNLRKTITRVGIMAAAVTVATVATATAAHAQTVHYVSGSDLSSGGCKVWMNWETKADGTGTYVQGVVASWNDTCVMALYREHNGSWSRISDYHWDYANDGSQNSTGFYWDGVGYKAHVCLTNKTTGGSGCGSSW